MNVNLSEKECQIIRDNLYENIRKHKLLIEAAKENQVPNLDGSIKYLNSKIEEFYKLLEKIPDVSVLC